MRKVFISYSRKDAEFARWLATSLSQNGFDVWIDVEDIQGGEIWSTAIQEGLSAAEALILILSPDSVASQNVMHEWQYFKDQKKPIIPVLRRPVDSDKQHFEINRVQYIDFTGNPDQEAAVALFKRLLEALQISQSERAAAKIAPPPAPAQSNRIGQLLSSPVLQGISALVTIIAFLVTVPSLLNQNSGEVNTPSITPTRAAPAMTATPLTTPGTLDISLIYGTRQTSFTIIVRGDSDLNGLKLQSSKGAEIVTDRFDVLADFGGYAPAGLCLRYVLEGESPPTPDDCEIPFEVSMSEADVFWYDIIANRSLDLVIYQNDSYLKPCSAAAKVCDYP